MFVWYLRVTCLVLQNGMRFWTCATATVAGVATAIGAGQGMTTAPVAHLVPRTSLLSAGRLGREPRAVEYESCECMFAMTTPLTLLSAHECVGVYC